MRTIRNRSIQKRGRAKVGPDPETTLGVTTTTGCRHHHLHLNTSSKPVHLREADGIAKGNQDPQPPGLGRVTGIQEVDPDLGPGTGAKGREDSITAVNTLRPGAALDQEIGQNIMEVAKRCLIELNTPTDECHMTATCCNSNSYCIIKINVYYAIIFIHVR